MTKSQIKHELKNEIKKVNKVIDQKIVRGIPYMREARYHKILLARLSVLQHSNVLARSMRAVTMMMF